MYHCVVSRDGVFASPVWHLSIVRVHFLSARTCTSLILVPVPPFRLVLCINILSSTTIMVGFVEHTLMSKAYVGTTSLFLGVFFISYMNPPQKILDVSFFLGLNMLQLYTSLEQDVKNEWGQQPRWPTGYVPADKTLDLGF